MELQSICWSHLGASNSSSQKLLSCGLWSYCVWKISFSPSSVPDGLFAHNFSSSVAKHSCSTAAICYSTGNSDLDISWLYCLWQDLVSNTILLNDRPLLPLVPQGVVARHVVSLKHIINVLCCRPCVPHFPSPSMAWISRYLESKRLFFFTQGFAVSDIWTYLIKLTQESGMSPSWGVWRWVDWGRDCFYFSGIYQVSCV